MSHHQQGGSAAIINRCRELFDDLEFSGVQAWKSAEKGRKVIGYMPVYVPRRSSMQPECCRWGSSEGETSWKSSRAMLLQSYICRIPRSTIELGLTGRLDVLDGMLFPSICDVIRNLSGMWQLMFKDKYVRYFDVPQNYARDIGGSYYVNELRHLLNDLEKLSGKQIRPDDLWRSIEVHNENRKAIQELYRYRAKHPENPSPDVYLVIRAGMVLPVEDHTKLIRDYLAVVEQEEQVMRDNCRVVVSGVFCEQPPLNLIRSIEMAGCYIVDDDFMLITRWLLEDVPTSGDPLQNLADGFLNYSNETAAKYVPVNSDKGQYLVQAVRENQAEGVIFAAPSFCDPALLDRPMLQNCLAEENIPYTAFKYAENSGQMQPIREQAGTFADSIKLWSA